jgi:hypothetical protein
VRKAVDDDREATLAAMRNSGPTMRDAADELARFWRRTAPAIPSSGAT